MMSHNQGNTVFKKEYFKEKKKTQTENSLDVSNDSTLNRSVKVREEVSNPFSKCFINLNSSAVQIVYMIFLAFCF